MSTYNAEEQQTVEAIQDWWRKYGMIAVIAFIVGIAGYLGWKYYNQSQHQGIGEISANYSQIMDDLSVNGVAEQAKVQAFIDENQESNYAVLASMTLAKYLAEDGQLDSALEQLNWSKKQNSDEILASLINYRIARIMMALEQYRQAIDLLSAEKTKSWQARNQELIGDIYLLQDNKEQALSAYQQAESILTEESQPIDPSLQMKLDDLAK